MRYQPDAHLNADDFRVRRQPNGVLQLSFGATHVCMTLDAALDLQYRLAAFLAQVESEEYAETPETPPTNLYAFPTARAKET